MPNRREFLLGAATLGLVGFAGACKKSRTPSRAVHAGVDFTVLVPPERDDAYPIVVAIPGNGGAPEHWIDGWKNFPGRAQIALPRGFQKEGDGYAWFPWTANMKDEKLAAAVAAAEERLWKGIADLAGRRRVVVAGYSQGAVLCFAMAARHPDVLLGSFPVAGACPEALLPKGGARSAPIVAFHGAKDDEFPIALARAAVDGFKQQGGAAELREYAGVGHSPSDKLHADLDVEMMKVLEKKV